MKYVLLCLITASVYLLLFSPSIFAQPVNIVGGGSSGDTTNNDPCRQRSLLSFPTWYEYLPVGPAPDCSVSPIRHSFTQEINIGATIGAILLAVIEILLRVAGIVAVGFIVYGGFIYMTSQGTPDKLQAGRQTLLNGVIGLVIASLAVAIVNLASNVLLR